MSNVSSTKGSKSGKLKRLKATLCTSSSSQNRANLSNVLDSSSETNGKHLLADDPEITFKPVQSAASSQRLQNARQYISCSADINYVDERHSPDTTSEPSRGQKNQSPDTTSNFQLTSENPSSILLDENCSVPDTTSKVNQCQLESGPPTTAVGYNVCVTCNRCTGNHVSSPQNSITINQPPFKRPRGRPPKKQSVETAHREGPQEPCICNNVKTEVTSPHESQIKAGKYMQSSNCNSQASTVKKLRGRCKRVSLENQNQADSTPISSKRKKINRLPAVVPEAVVPEVMTPSNISKSMKKSRTHRNTPPISKKSPSSASVAKMAMFSDMSKFKITVTFDENTSVSYADLFSNRKVVITSDECQNSPENDIADNMMASSPIKIAKKSRKIKLKISPKLYAKTGSPVKATAAVCQTLLSGLTNRTVGKSKGKERKNSDIVSAVVSPTISTVEEGSGMQSISASNSEQHLLVKSDTITSSPPGDVFSVFSSQSFDEESSETSEICVHQSPHTPKFNACVLKESRKLYSRPLLSSLVAESQNTLCTVKDSQSGNSKKRTKKARSAMSSPSVNKPICNITASPINDAKKCNEPFVAIHKISSEFISNPGLLLSEMATCEICSPLKSIEQNIAVSHRKDDGFISILENFNETDKLCEKILLDNAKPESSDTSPTYTMEEDAREEQYVVEDTVAENYFTELLYDEYYNQSQSTEPNQIKETMIEAARIGDKFNQNEISEVDDDCDAMVKTDVRNEDLAKENEEGNTVDKFAYLADAVVDLEPIVNDDSINCQSVTPLPTTELIDDVTDGTEAVADGLLNNSFDLTKIVSHDLTIEEVCDTDSDDGSNNYSQADTCNKSEESHTPAEADVNEKLDCYEIPDTTNFMRQKPEVNKHDSDAELFKCQGILSEFFISSFLTDNNLEDFLKSSEESEEGIFVTNRKLIDDFLVKATLSHDRNKHETDEAKPCLDVICSDVPETCIPNVDMKSLPEDLLNVDINFDLVDESFSVATDTQDSQDLTEILNKIKAASSGIDFSPKVKIEHLTETIVDNTCNTHYYITEDFHIWRRRTRVLTDFNLQATSAYHCESSNLIEGKVNSYPGKAENETMVNDQESSVLNDFERAISKPCVIAKKKKRHERPSGEMTNDYVSKSSKKDSHKKCETSPESSRQHSELVAVEANSMKGLSIDDIILKPTDSFLQQNIKRKKSPRKEVNSRIVKRILLKRASEVAIASSEVLIPEVPLSAIETFSLNTSSSSSSTSKLDKNVTSPKRNLTKQLDITPCKVINKNVDSLFGFPKGINFGRSFRKSDEGSNIETSPATSIFSHDRDGLKYPPLYEPSGSSRSESDSSISIECRNKRKWDKEAKSLHQNQTGIRKLPRLPPSYNSEHSETTSQVAETSKIMQNSYFQSSSKSAKPFLFGKLSESAAAKSPTGSLFGVSKNSLFGGAERRSFTFGVKSPPLVSSGNNLQSIWTTFSPIARNKDEPKASVDVGSKNVSDFNIEDQRFSSDPEDSATEDDCHIDEDISKAIKVENMGLLDDVEGEELDYEYENSDEGEGMFVHSTPDFDKKEENKMVLSNDLLRNEPPQSPGISQDQLSDKDSLHEFPELTYGPPKNLDFSEISLQSTKYESPTLRSNNDMLSPLPKSRLLSPNCDTDENMLAEHDSKQANVTPIFKTPYSDSHLFSDNTTLELDVSVSNLLSGRSSNDESESHDSESESHDSESESHDSKAESHDSMSDSEDNSKQSTVSSDNESKHSMHGPSSASDMKDSDDDDFDCDAMSIYAPSAMDFDDDDDEEDPAPQIPIKRVPVTFKIVEMVPATRASTLPSLMAENVSVPPTKEKAKNPTSCLFGGPQIPPQIAKMNIKHMTAPGHCHSHLKHQNCQYGGSCRFKHILPTMDDVFSTTVANIEKYCKCLNIQFAFEAYRCLVKYFSHKIPEIVYHLLIELCAEVSQIKTAFSLVKEICDHKLLNARMVDALVQMCRVDPETHVDNLRMLFSTFSMLNIQPSDESFPILLQCFHNTKELDYLWKVLLYCNECEFNDIPVAIVNKALVIAVNNPQKFLSLAVEWLEKNNLTVVEKAQRQLLDRFIDCCKEHKRMEVAERLSEFLKQHKPSQVRSVKCCGT